MEVDGLSPGLTASVADPTVKTAFDTMGIAHDLQEWQKVVDVGDAWYAARGQMSPTAATWYAQALQGVGRYQEAVQWAGVAAKHMPKDEPIPQIAAWSTYSQALARIGHFERARVAMSTAVSIKIDHDETMEKQGHMLACLALSAKKGIVVHGSLVPKERLWAKAWGMMERRLSQEEKRLPPGYRPWDGVTKEPVTVLHEQGLGDAVLTARWLPWLVEMTGHPVTYLGPKILLPWIGEIPGVVLGDFDLLELRGNQGEDLGAAIRCMSLAYHQHMKSPKDVPAPWAPPSLLRQRIYRKVREADDDRAPVRIGVCWKGATIGWHNFERSYMPEQFAPIFAPLDGVKFVNLAHETDAPEGSGMERAEFRDVMHTGTVIAALDLVVTVDTGVAHIAGSLGVPTVVIPPTVPDWRYQWPRGDSTVFYPSLTVMRRQKADDVRVIQMARKIVEQYAQALTARSA